MSDGCERFWKKIIPHMKAAMAVTAAGRRPKPICSHCMEVHGLRNPLKDSGYCGLICETCESEGVYDYDVYQLGRDDLEISPHGEVYDPRVAHLCEKCREPLEERPGYGLICVWCNPVLIGTDG